MRQRSAGRRAVVLLVALVVLAGCGGPDPVTVAVGTGSARVEVGAELRVQLGEVNASIGDSWHLLGAPDPAVLTDNGAVTELECEQPGCGGTMDWTFTATGPGVTALVFQYCYRSRPPQCEPQPGRGPAEPVTLTVTVN
jgi:predicted secreted protein